MISSVAALHTCRHFNFTSNVRQPYTYTWYDPVLAPHCVQYKVVHLFEEHETTSGATTIVTQREQAFPIHVRDVLNILAYTNSSTLN